MYFGFCCWFVWLQIKRLSKINLSQKDLIAKTSCEDELFLEINPNTIEVRSVYNSYGAYWDKEVYKYKNDGKYSIEKKEC